MGRRLVVRNVCIRDACGRPVDARKLCQAHYKAARAAGEFGGAPCSLQGCGKILYARGWCRLHYNRWREQGDPEWLPPTATERFQQRVRMNGECWEWKGQRTVAGYGRFRSDDGFGYAHRWSYEHHVGQIPQGLTIDHLCRNTWCVNPAHLESVTAGENALRGTGPSAQNARKTHCVRGHAFDEDNTSILPGGGRRCLACHRLRQRRYSAVRA